MISSAESDAQLERGWGHTSILLTFLCNFAILATQREGHGPMASLKYAPVGNKPTFRTKTREEVLDLTLVNRCAWNQVVRWHVSDVPSFSDHMYIRFQVKSRIRKQAKMFRNVRRTCWNKNVNELEQKLNDRTRQDKFISSLSSSVIA